MRLVEGLGKLDNKKTVLVPSIVPCGVSLSMKPGVPDEVGVPFFMTLFTIALRLDTDVSKPASVVLNPLKLDVIVLSDVERAFRYELKPVTCPIEIAVVPEELPDEGKVVRTCASVSGLLLGPTCHVSTQLVSPSRLLNVAT